MINCKKFIYDGHTNKCVTCGTLYFDHYFETEKSIPVSKIEELVKEMEERNNIYLKQIEDCDEDEREVIISAYTISSELLMYISSLNKLIK